jgi:DNA-binding NarL/FixJ family response regulator
LRSFGPIFFLDTALVPAAEQNIVRDLPKKCSCLRIVALTTPDPHHSAFAVQLGASGVLCKDAPLDLVLMCIRSVIAGQYCIACEDAAALLRGRCAAPRAPAPGEANFGLTAREEQVVTPLQADPPTRRSLGRADRHLPAAL